MNDNEEAVEKVWARRDGLVVRKDGRIGSEVTQRWLYMGKQGRLKQAAGC